MTRSNGGSRSERGSIDTLPSGAKRVRVYAGHDPISKRPYYLTEVVPPGPKADDQARKVRTRLANEVDEGRAPRTSATVSQLVEKHLESADLAPKTMRGYWSCYRNHIKPLIGDTGVGKVDAHALDSFYAELRRCQTHCAGRPFVEHRTDEPHECDEKCKPHVCKPLGASSIRGAHYLLSGAFRRAIRWQWVHKNPTASAESPSAPPPDPQPPTPEEAAKIINTCWDDPLWGTLVWLAMTTGARRGELSALRWRHVELEKAVLTVRRSIDQNGAETIEKETKSHQKRRISLDPDTVEILRDHRARCEHVAAEVGVKLLPDSFVFSLAVDGSSLLKPDTITRRYRRLVDRLGISTTFHKLRHFSATELISAGVDPRTVGGRLGHGSGGVTTLRVYSAWVSESDQRAAENFVTRMPARPSRLSRAERAKDEPSAPYERIAANIRLSILDGELQPGGLAPSQKEIVAEHGVSAGTANRVYELLGDWCLVEIRPGKRALILEPPDEPEIPDLDSMNQSATSSEYVEVELLHMGASVRKFSAKIDVSDPSQLERVLASAVRRIGAPEADVPDYEIEVTNRETGELLARFTVA